MKILYYLSYILSAPFWALAWVFYGLSIGLDYVGGTIHDKTTYRAWLVLHQRDCARSNTAVHARTANDQ